MFHALTLVDDLASKDPAIALRLYRALAEPFGMRALEDSRLRTLLVVASRLGTPACEDALRWYEPHFPWDADLMTTRQSCYALAPSPLLTIARREHDRFDECNSGFRWTCW
jgi:hypothetical protein